MALLKKFNYLGITTLFLFSLSQFAIAGTSLTYNGSFRIEKLDTHVVSTSQIKVKFESQTDKIWLLQFDGEAKKILSQIQLDFNNPNALQISGLNNLKLTLTNSPDLGCYRNDNPYLMMCWGTTGFQLDFISANQQISVWAYDMHQAPTQLINNPATTFTIEDLRKTSINKSFDNRAEFERVIQARELSKASHLALLPRLTFNSAFNLATAGGLGMGIIQSLADLAPFLFPTNWINAEASELRSQAESKTLIIQKLNVQQQVEGLCDLILLNSAILSNYRDLLKELQDIREEVDTREKLGQYMTGSVDNVDAIIYPLISDITSLSENIEDQKRDLSVMVGFANPETIQNVSWQSEPYPIEKPFEITKENSTKWSIERSVELAQVDVLIDLANNQMEQSVWSWLDPSGAPFTGIGFHYPAMIEVSAAHIREMGVQKEQLKAQITNSALTVVDAIERSQENYLNALKMVEVQTRRKNLFIDQIKLGVLADMRDFPQIQRDYIDSIVRRENYHSEYRAARAKVQRLILDGAYAGITSTK